MVFVYTKRDPYWQLVSRIAEHEPLFLYTYFTLYLLFMRIDVDRLPLVSSCIINIDQDVTEPWPIEVYDHKGKAYNVTMEPGDVVLYESSTVLHGRPFPLKGNYFANIFVHFKPFIHDELNEKDHEAQQIPGFEPISVRRRHGQRSSPMQHLSPDSKASGDEYNIMVAASQGQIEEIRRILEKKPVLVNYKDQNGWQPVHEAVRAGHFETVKFLVSKGADLSAKVMGGDDALSLAKEHLPSSHKLMPYLEEMLSNKKK